MTMQHIFITEGSVGRGDTFEIYQRGDELQLYWSDGELNVTELQPWEVPAVKAEEWIKELKAVPHLN